MPFTPSHAAAILPFRRVAGGALPLAALAAGSMSPDLPYYVPVLGLLNRWTHTPVGVVTVDLLLGVVMWALWRSAARPLRDLSPAAVRERWTLPDPGAARLWAVLVAVTVGAATHVAWDEFTHADRWGTTHLAVLSAPFNGPLGPLPGYRYAQYASGAIGLAIIVVAALRQPRRPATPAPAGRLARALPWLCLAAAMAGALGRISASGGFDRPWDALAFAGITGGLGAAGATLLLVCWTRALAPRVVGWARASGGAAGQ